MLQEDDSEHYSGVSEHYSDYLGGGDATRGNGRYAAVRI